MIAQTLRSPLLRTVFSSLVCCLAAIASAAPAAADAPAPTRSAARFEVKYLTTTIDHHFMAVQMAELCPGRAVHPELLELCAQIAADQSAEIEQLQAWLLDWYGIQNEPTMKRGQARQLQKLAALSGPEFEIEFMEMMIKHHEKAVRDAEKCLDKAYHPELHEFCSHVIEEQSAEIALMESWLCIWYGLC